MRYQTLGNKPNFIAIRVRNTSATAMTAGQPVAFEPSDTSADGLAVQLPADSNAGATAFFAGVLTSALAVNAYGEAIVYGVVDAAVTINTRAATTDSWTSRAAIAAYQILAVDTVNNAFLTAASMASSAFLPNFVVIEAVASQAASASTTANALTVVTSKLKVFVRALG